MIEFTWIFGAILSSLIIVLLLIWVFRKHKASKSFSMELSVQKNQLYSFLKDPSNLEKVHPNIEKVCSTREEDGTLYFEIVEDVGRLAGKQTFTLSLDSCIDESTMQSILRVKAVTFLAQVTISLAIGDDDVEQTPHLLGSNLPPPASSLSSPLSSSSTPMPSKSQANQDAALQRRHQSSPAAPKATVRVTAEVISLWGISYLISSSMTQIWRSTLSSTERLLNARLSKLIDTS